MCVRVSLTIRLMRTNCSGDEAHGGSSTLPTDVPSSCSPNSKPFSLISISGRKNNSGISSWKKTRYGRLDRRVVFNSKNSTLDLVEVSPSRRTYLVGSFSTTGWPKKRVDSDDQICLLATLETWWWTVPANIKIIPNDYSVKFAEKGV